MTEGKVFGNKTSYLPTTYYILVSANTLLT